MFDSAPCVNSLTTVRKHESLSPASPLLLFHTLPHRLPSLPTDRADMESTEERNSERRRKEREGGKESSDTGKGLK